MKNKVSKQAMISTSIRLFLDIKALVIPIRSNLERALLVLYIYKRKSLCLRVCVCVCAYGFFSVSSDFEALRRLLVM